MFLTNKYTKWYFQIIYRAFGQNRSKNSAEYFEEHHIIPDSLGGNNDKTNLVLLTAREHFIVHWILTKCLEGESKVKMIYAFWRMVSHKNKRRNYSSRYYEIARKKYSKILSLRTKGILKGSKLDIFKDDIINLYKSGKSTHNIAKIYNCSDITVSKLLKRNNVRIRSSFEYAELNLPVDTIIKLYEDGLDTTDLACQYGCNPQSITNILKRNNIIIRSSSESRKFKKLNPHLNEIIDLYLNKNMTCNEISKLYNCKSETISKLLRTNGVKLRKRSLKERPLTLESYKNDIINLYLNEKLSTVKISKIYKCNPDTVTKILKRNGVKIRFN